MKIGKIGIIISFSLCALIAFHYYRTVAVAFFDSPGWPTVQGKVIKSYIGGASPTGSAHENFMPKVVYVYSVDGVNYERNKIFFLEDGRGLSWSKKKVAKYKIDQQVLVFYNPQDPRISVLEPGGSIKGIFLSGVLHFIVISVLLVLAFALLWDYRKAKKRIDKQK
jgi:hypothetical protein